MTKSKGPYSGNRRQVHLDYSLSIIMIFLFGFVWPLAASSVKVEETTRSALGTGIHEKKGNWKVFVGRWKQSNK